MTDRSEEVRKERLHQRAKIAALSRSRAADDVDLLAAKRDLAALKIEAAILDYQGDPDNSPMDEAMIERLTAIIMGQEHG